MYLFVFSSHIQIIPAWFSLIHLIILDFQILTLIFRCLFSFISSTFAIQLFSLHCTFKLGFSQNIALSFPFILLLPNLSGALRTTPGLTSDLKIQLVPQTFCQSPVFLQTHTHLARGRGSLTETEIMQIL